MNKFTTFIAASVVGLASIAPASANFILDDFTYAGGEESISVNVTNPSSATFFSPLASFDYTLEGADISRSSGDPEVFTGAGLLEYASAAVVDTNRESILPISLSIDATPSSALDFASLGTHFAVVIESLDLDDGFDVTASLVSGGTTYSTTKAINFEVDLGSPFTFLVPLTDFVDGSNNSYMGGAVASTNVTFDIDSADVDFVISSFGIVPEPATLALLGLGLVGLGLRRRKLV